jgi:hypothetical protein
MLSAFFVVNFFVVNTLAVHRLRPNSNVILWNVVYFQNGIRLDSTLSFRQQALGIYG